MKRLHLRFVNYISGVVCGVLLTHIMVTLSVFLFVQGEIFGGVVALICGIVIIVALWFGLRCGLIVDYKKNRLKLNFKTYALDTVKGVNIAFKFAEKTLLNYFYSASVTVYFKNGKAEKEYFYPQHHRGGTSGITPKIKRDIEIKAADCDLIQCFTVK